MPETTDKPIYCPRRRQHGAVCETPDGCAGGADCRLGLDLDQAMNDWPTASRTTPEMIAEARWLDGLYTGMCNPAEYKPLVQAHILYYSWEPPGGLFGLSKLRMTEAYKDV